MAAVNPQPEVAEILADAARACGSDLRLDARGPRRDTWRASSERHVATVAAERRGRVRLGRESSLYGWAEAQGIPVAPVAAVDPGGSFLVLRKVPVDPPEGDAYVTAALAAADAFARARPPDSHLMSGERDRRPRLRSAPLRYARLTRAGLRPTELVWLDRKVRRLPRPAIGHGDFHPTTSCSTEPRQRSTSWISNSSVPLPDSPIT